MISFVISSSVNPTAKSVATFAIGYPVALDAKAELLDTAVAFITTENVKDYINENYDKEYDDVVEDDAADELDELDAVLPLLPDDFNKLFAR